MRVFDASDKSVFDHVCGQLADKVSESVGYPDIIIGIRSGGAHVASAVASRFPRSEVGYVIARRPSTGGKKRFGVGTFLRYLPVRILDMLRIIEARVLARSGNPERQVTLEIPDNLLMRMKQPDTVVVVVDDAVDSGYTLQAVLAALKPLTGGPLYTAAVTSTVDSPVVAPDIMLYNDNTLVRFPWSMDAKR